MEKQKYVTVSILVFLAFILEYTWLPWAGDKVYYSVPFIYSDGPVRLDSWIYNVSVKVRDIIPMILVYILTPFKKESKFLIAAFTLALIEFFFTWNEPIYKIWLPDLWVIHPYIPISTAPIKLIAVCYFMWAVVKKALE